MPGGRVDLDIGMKGKDGGDPLTGELHPRLQPMTSSMSPVANATRTAGSRAHTPGSAAATE